MCWGWPFVFPSHLESEDPPHIRAPCPQGRPGRPCHPSFPIFIENRKVVGTTWGSCSSVPIQANLIYGVVEEIQGDPRLAVVVQARETSLVPPEWPGCQGLLSFQSCARSPSHGNAEDSTLTQCGKRCMHRAIISSALFLPLAVGTS